MQFSNRKSLCFSKTKAGEKASIVSGIGQWHCLKVSRIASAKSEPAKSNPRDKIQMS